MDPKEAIELLERYRKGECTEAETLLIEKWYQSLLNSADFYWEAGEKETTEQLIHNRLLQQIGNGASMHPIQKRTRVISLWRKVAVAAAIIIIAAVVVGVLTNNHKQSTSQPTVAKTHDVPAPKDNRAVITLADGRKLYLDSVANGTIAQQGSVNVMKNKNGDIVYAVDHQITPSPGHPITYNTAFNPRGSKVLPLTLLDGTKVWLNAESSLKYPTAFNGNTREVEITGEAYFEVAHDASKPFKVKKGDVEVTVLGTHFNVNAYDDEDALRVTLLEGSVKVSTVIASTAKQSPGRNSVIIKPGQQAIVKPGSPDRPITQSPDLVQVMAWKNGLFSFNNSDLKTVMRQVARWYDVDVVYQNEISSQKFGGEIPRSSNLSQVLEMLKASGVNFSMQDRKIFVVK